MTLTRALAQSINSVAAKIAVSAGPENVVTTAHRLGINSDLVANASLALGTSEVSLLEMTTAFTPFANGGRAVLPYVVTRITTRDGKVIYERKGSGLGVVVADADVGAMNLMMREVVRSGTGKRARIEGQDIAGKTGTSQDYRDAWFVGYSPYLVCGVWVGNDDNRPTRNVTGGALPTDIWKDVMGPAHKGVEFAALPGDYQPAPESRFAQRRHRSSTLSAISSAAAQPERLGRGGGIRRQAAAEAGAAHQAPPAQADRQVDAGRRDGMSIQAASILLRQRGSELVGNRQVFIAAVFNFSGRGPGRLDTKSSR